LSGEPRDSVASALARIPESLRVPLLTAYGEIVRNFRERRWEPSELNGGKFSEIVYSILCGFASGSYPARPEKPANMVDACRALEREVSMSAPRSVRIQIPRMLIALYEVRNNRGVGHSGGDVDPNHMDAAAVVAMAKWTLSELVRLFHEVDTAHATAIVDAIVERELPLIWVVDGKRRVLVSKMTHKDKSLALLYTEHGAVPEDDLFAWVEHPRLADFRKDILRPLHRSKLVEYDPIRRTVALSPLGSDYVEKKLLTRPAS
jgi:hypothetical protein